MPSAPIRGKQLDLLGYSGFGVPCAVFADGYRELVELVVAGEIVMPVQRFGLPDVGTRGERRRAVRGRSWSTSRLPAADGPRSGTVGG